MSFLSYLKWRKGDWGGGWREWREEEASLSSWTELVFTTSEIATCWLPLLAPGIIVSFICKEVLQTFIFYLKPPSNIRVVKYIFSELLFQVDSFVLTLCLWLPSHPLPLLRKIHSIVKQTKDRINFWILSQNELMKGFPSISQNGDISSTQWYCGWNS